MNFSFIGNSFTSKAANWDDIISSELIQSPSPIAHTTEKNEVCETVSVTVTDLSARAKYFEQLKKIDRTILNFNPFSRKKKEPEISHAQHESDKFIKKIKDGRSERTTEFLERSDILLDWTKNIVYVYFYYFHIFSSYFKNLTFRARIKNSFSIIFRPVFQSTFAPED